MTETSLPRPDAASKRTVTPPRLFLPPAQRARVEAWCREGYPYEACGLLIGGVEGELTRVVEVARAGNRATERLRDRYLMDPADQLAAEFRARELGLSVVGIWHSHPDHPARPSETDRAGAYERYSYVIVSVTAEGVVDLRSFRLRGARFVEEQLVEEVHP